MTPMRNVQVVLLWGFVALAISSSPATPQGPDTNQASYRSVPALPGERCTVCGAELGENGVALIVRGRRVPLDTAMVGEFLQNKEKYFARLQPKAALFQEELDAPRGTAQGGVSTGWFFLGLYVLTALVCGGLSAYAAIGKGLKPLSNFFIGFFCNIFGYIYVLSRPRERGKHDVPPGLVKVPVTSAPMPCPACGSANHPTASRCATCHRILNPLSPSEVSKVL